MKRAFCQMFLLLFFVGANAQNKYWVSFRDKQNVNFDPYSYFDKRAIEQRRALNISITDSSDFPVNPEYILKITQIVDSMSWSSRWLNGVAVYADKEKINIVNALPFVKEVFEMNTTSFTTSTKRKRSSKLKSTDNVLLHFQTQRMQSDSFLVNHLDGSGIRVAVFDAGFPNANSHPAFAHLRNGKQIIDTYDFVKRNENVYHGHWHGTATLSCIGGKKDSVNIGMATGAEFLLARTERVLWERYSEEENWVAAAEWADRQGVNIISSSLGYGYTRYFNNQMDGRTSLVSCAATIAASKGILVVNSAGNEGNNSWHNIITPADADSVLSVGGTDPYGDVHIFFSSFGPSSSGSLKPNVCAVGQAIVAVSNGYAQQYGTSFSAPLVAGFAACAWQSHRQWTNMDLFDAIEKSSHLYPYFDYAHGFGIPQAGRIISQSILQEPTFDFVIINNEIKVILREKYSYPETEEALGYPVMRNFYYKTENKDGAIKRYTVLIAGKKEMLHFYAEDFQTGDVLTVHFEGYTSTIDFPEEIK
jgi:serine protease AprX